jgi:hypothetical protein
MFFYIDDCNSVVLRSLKVKKVNDVYEVWYLWSDKYSLTIPYKNFHKESVKNKNQQPTELCGKLYFRILFQFQKNDK